MHHPKNGKRMLERVVEAIGNFMAKPVSDESNETPGVAEVNRGKASAAGTMHSKATKKKRSATGATKKRSAAKKGRATKKRAARK